MLGVAMTNAKTAFLRTIVTFVLAIGLFGDSAMMPRRPHAEDVPAR